MLTLKLDKLELYDESKNEFITKEAMILKLEHSLASVSKWESIYEVPFLTDREKTQEETFAYVKCMILDEDFDEDISYRLTNEHLQKINDYVTSKMTATWFSEPKDGKPKSREIITAEIIYYWMTALNIPFECEKWHLSRLFTLIRVVNEKTQQASNQGKKKPMTKSDISSRRALNEARKRQLGTTG